MAGTSDRSAGRIEWERFWVSRTGNIDLSDNGFMVDPTAPYTSRASRPFTLIDLQTFRALALLGEPGMGKTTALNSESDRVSQADQTGQKSLRVDLRAFSSEELFYRRIFEGPEISDWKTGNEHLTFYLDSLDEALLRIDTIANLLAAELPSLPITRLSIRIACRTSMWPSRTLEPVLQKIWGDKSFGAFELAPLRRRDVVQAAEQRGLDANAFVTTVLKANAVPFAIKPLTLNLLLSLFQRNGQLPKSGLELYRLGCLTLVEESNDSRRDTGLVGTLNAQQRIAIAGRIAAVTMLANRYAIDTGPQRASIASEDVSLSVLAGGSETANGESFRVTEAALREVLDTGLFTSRGVGRMGWAHQGYTEFLSAQYLTESGTSPLNILKVLHHPSGGIVPQLSVMASWAASMKEEVRDGLIASDPIVVLRGDLSNWDAGDRQKLVTALLDAFDAGHTTGQFIGLSHAYSSLAHPTLDAQIRPYIVDQKKRAVVRRAATIIAEECGLRGLQADLLKIALDQTEKPELRARAVAALRTCGDETVPGVVMPLAKGELGPDPNEDIKGNALRIVWPNHISAADLFAILTRGDDGYFGAYALFLGYELPPSLSKGDLLPALRWATAFIPGTLTTHDYQRKNLADKILTRAWEFVGEPEFAELFVENILARLALGGGLFRGTVRSEHEELAAAIKTDSTRRRAIVLVGIKRGIDRMQAFYLRGALVLQEDFPWLLALLVESNLSSAETVSVCNLIEVVFDHENAEQFAQLYEVATELKALRQRYAAIFDGVALDSPSSKRTSRILQHIEANRTTCRPLS